jgi:hypothetical protein
MVLFLKTSKRNLCMHFSTPSHDHPAVSAAIILSTYIYQVRSKVMKLFILQYPSHQVNVCTSPSCLETSYCYSVSARGGLTPHAAKPMVGSASCGITCHGRSLAVIKPSKGQAMDFESPGGLQKGQKGREGRHPGATNAGG